MNAVLQFFRDIDISFYYLLCKGHGNWFLDRVASFQASNTLLKSGVLIAVYWYFWFRKGTERQERRKVILTIIGATLVGLAVTRLVATFLPFRVRPLYDPNFLGNPLSFNTPMDFVNWSSFPSDHASYLGALAFGLTCLSHRLRIPAAVYLVGWIWFPRMYLGIHYASDMVVGSAIGAAAVWAALRIGVARSRAAQSVLTSAEVKPEWFYPAAYLVLFEMSVIFSDIRSAAHSLLRAVSVSGYGTVIGVGLLLMVALCAIGMAAFHSAKKYSAGISDVPTKELN